MTDENVLGKKITIVIIYDMFYKLLNITDNEIVAIVRVTAILFSAAELKDT